MINKFYKWGALLMVVAVLQLTSACQTYKGFYPYVDTAENGANTGVYVHDDYFSQALVEVQRALNRTPASFSGLPIDASLESELRYQTGSADASHDAVKSWKLIDQHVIDDGPYLLITVDENYGQLEFESVSSGAYLSVYVEAREAPDGQARFKIVGVSAEPLLQASLAE